MSTNQSRIEVFVDIFDVIKQRAQVLPTVTSTDMIEGILQEFTEVAYLGDNPAGYHLCKAGDRAPLKEGTPLREQLQPGDHLILRENEAPLPNATQRPSQPLYLREPSTGTVFPIQWVPAIIGRNDAAQSDNDQLAVDLEAFPTGLRVSRRHAVITEEQGAFYVASLSSNGTVLKQVTGEQQAVTAEKVILTQGQKIHLARSGIDLQVIVRNGDGITQNPPAA